MTSGNTEAAASLTQDDAWLSLAGSVIESLSTHILRWNEKEYVRFRQGLRENLDLLRNHPTPSSIRTSAAAFSQRIQQYLSQTQRMVEDSVSELRDMVRVLVASLDQFQQEGDASRSALGQITDTIGKAVTAEDLRLAKTRLSDVLQQVTQRVQERQAKTAELITNLQKRVLLLEQSVPAGAPPKPVAAGRECESIGCDASLDFLTGLPNKEAAENVILGLQAGPARAFLAVFYLQRLEQVNARMGDRIGNELVLLSAQRLVNTLRPGDQIFRWRGPAFVALLRREDALLDVRREMQRLIAPRFQFSLRGGAMIVSVGVAADVFPAEPGRSAELFQEVESFFSKPSTRG